MKRTIRITEANGKKSIIVIPIDNIEYIQASLKDSGDTHVRLKATTEHFQKYFFVSETVEEIEAQINAS